MKLLSLWEPWATLMAIGAKRIETRSWATSYRGWLAIHVKRGYGWDVNPWVWVLEFDAVEGPIQ